MRVQDFDFSVKIGDSPHKSSVEGPISRHSHLSRVDRDDPTLVSFNPPRLIDQQGEFIAATAEKLEPYSIETYGFGDSSYLLS